MERFRPVGLPNHPPSLDDTHEPTRRLPALSEHTRRIPGITRLGQLNYSRSDANKHGKRRFLSTKFGSFVVLRLHTKLRHVTHRQRARPSPDPSI